MFSHHRNRRKGAKSVELKQAKPKAFRCCDYLCSRCHQRLKSGVYNKTKHIEMTFQVNARNGKLEPVFEVISVNASVAGTALDHWCFRCIADAPPKERIRKLSKGKRLKLLAKELASLFVRSDGVLKRADALLAKVKCYLETKAND